ncbi:MAG: HDIG domain-containing protein [Candidatus Cloacimonetes bacterium]|nr:HDIG domain-containing protein [Candidatus Cloacimonadota bacterium]
MKLTKIHLILLASAAIALLHSFFNPYRVVSHIYTLKLGEIAEKDINAPFDFYVYKSSETLEAEQTTAAAKVQPIYKVSENLKFNAQKNLDFVFQHFVLQDVSNIQTINRKLRQNGYNLSNDNIRLLMDNQRRSRLYNFLSENITKIFTVGIYPDNYQYQEIKISKPNRVISYGLDRLYSLEEAKNKLVSWHSVQGEKNLIRELADIVLIENIIIDQEMTDVEMGRAKEKIPLTLGKVQKNERIIGKNQKITSIELLKLESLVRAQHEHQPTRNSFQMILSSLGIFLLSVLILFLFDYILLLFFPNNFSTLPRTIIILGSILVSIVLTIFINNILKIPSLIIPFSFSVMLIALIFNPHVGIIFNSINLIFVSLFLNWSLTNPLILCLTTFGGIIALTYMKKKQEFYPITLYLLLSFFVVNTAVALIKFESFNIYLWHLLWGIISCTTSVVGLVLITPIVERKLNLATKQILLELLDFDNELLKKLALSAPGTYHHSLIVGNLAESASEAVSANHLLARVASYYHDIGKLENPQFFIENNPLSTKLHDKMMANESAHLIRNHINDGLVLARKHNLPKAVIEIIQQHHGTGQIKYFYNKALETNLEFDIDQFMYSGPKPLTKEASIVMIADIVESTTKSLDDFSEDKIKEVLDNTIKNLINEGQLDQSPLTIKELDTIKVYMLPILMGVYRKRLEYPEN